MSEPSPVRRGSKPKSHLQRCTSRGSLALVSSPDSQPCISFDHTSNIQAHRAKEAMQELEGFISRFPEFEEIARVLIKTIRRESKRTPQSDRAKVFEVFDQATTVLALDEIAEDARLPRKDVKLILREFLDTGIIELRTMGGSRNCGRGGTNGLYAFPDRPHFYR